MCVDTARLRDWFPDDKIHSGESDFVPPRFKPDPGVYLKAAAAEGVPVSACIAVEDSVSGVGSAANAEIALIVGYVGASHISAAAQDGHAATLMQVRAATRPCPLLLSSPLLQLRLRPRLFARSALVVLILLLHHLLLIIFLLLLHLLLLILLIPLLRLLILLLLLLRLRRLLILHLR